MSTAHEEHPPTSHADHDHAHAHAFDGEPVTVLPPDEPRTPGWLPALGLLLFVLAGIAFLATGGDEAKDPAAESEKGGAQAQAAPVRPADAPAAAANPPAPGAPSAPSLARLSPEQAKALQQRIEQAKARQAAPDGTPNSGLAIQPQPPQPIRPRPLPVPPPGPAPGGQAP